MSYFSPTDPYSFIDSWSDRSNSDRLKKPVWGQSENIAPYGEIFNSKDIGGRFPGYSALVAVGFVPTKRDFGGSSVLGSSGIASSLSFGMAAKFTAIQVVNIFLTGSISGASTAFKLRSDGKIWLNSFSETISTKAIKEQTFYYFEGHLGFIESAGSPDTHKITSIKLKLDGELVINVASIDTGVIPPAGIGTYINPSTIVLNGLGGLISISDFYLRIGGDMLTDVVHSGIEGTPRVMVLKPTADGVFTEWPSTTPGSPLTHYDKVDEIPRDSSDFVETTVAPVSDSYSTESIPISITPTSRKVLAIQPSYYREGFGGTDPDTSEFSVTEHLLNADKGDVAGGSDIYNLMYRETDPGTGLPFTVSSVNSLDSGVIAEMRAP